MASAACQGGAVPLPDTPPPLSANQPDPGFPIQPRPDCAPDVVAAAGDPDAIRRVAAAGGHFTCGSTDDPTPLDLAVLNDAPDVVRALLAARADPNARWSSHGDRFPLQEALEARAYGRSTVHRLDIIRLLLQHGANPSARWCPFETRGGGGDGPLPFCTSPWGATPLIMAVRMGDAETIGLLLDAGADVRPKDWQFRTAETYAREAGRVDIAYRIRASIAGAR